ncbi:Uma2 family endonuclease [Pseudanabaena sp. PCC 6802]|uniref:Uma2 family endonuclease n=1 Tax=Pseudanabaena sp. PCC 6802 TaxID=118173 RepID=UPI000346A219|nr:Uma2 family endonuclease [Pseudanabaena sp. PCC 6802]
MRVTLDIPQADLERLVSPAIAESRILLHEISWQAYEQLVEIFRDRPHLRLTYLEGNLEIMTTSLEHEALKKILARLLEIYALEVDIPLYSYGSATFKQAAQMRGLEPDESYCIGNRKEFPDLAIEIVVTSGNIDLLEIYKGLQVLEVWFWQDGQLALYRLREDRTGYDTITRSELFPNLDINLLPTYIRPEEEPEAVKAWRDVIRNSQV